MTFVDFLIEEKPSLKRVHNSLFYVDGKYYNISNRMVGIHYVSGYTHCKGCYYIFSSYFAGVAKGMAATRLFC